MDSLFNGGADVARFELLKKYLSHLLTPEIDTICSLIKKLTL